VPADDARFGVISDVDDTILETGVQRVGQMVRQTFTGSALTVLIGDSGEKDPEIYADIVRSHPDRVLAVYIREVRLDPGDGRVEQVSDAWDHDVPFVLAADSDAVRRHAMGLGLLRAPS
jgi:phosphatidate phosphatase APP1